MKRKSYRVYLSGGMEYARAEGADWRMQLHRWIDGNLGHSVFNPNEESKRFLAKHFPNGDFRKLKSSDTQNFIRLVRRIVDLDSGEIAHKSDYIICYWDRSAQRGAGTKGELTIAKFFGKPVYMVTRMKYEQIPGWILGCTSKIFRSFSELKLFLKQTYANHKQR